MSYFDIDLVDDVLMHKLLSKHLWLCLLVPRLENEALHHFIYKGCPQLWPFLAPSEPM